MNDDMLNNLLNNENFSDLKDSFSIVENYLLKELDNIINNTSSNNLLKNIIKNIDLLRVENDELKDRIRCLEHNLMETNSRSIKNELEIKEFKHNNI